MSDWIVSIEETEREEREEREGGGMSCIIFPLAFTVSTGDLDRFVGVAGPAGLSF